MPLQTEKHSVSENIPVMISMVRASFLFSVWLVLVDEKNDILSVTPICLCYHRDVTFIPYSFTEETFMLLNSYMKGLVLINVGLEWLAYVLKKIEVNYNIMFPDYCRHTPGYHNITCLNLWGNIFKDMQLEARCYWFHLKEALRIISIFLDKIKRILIKQWLGSINIKERWTRWESGCHLFQCYMRIVR